MFNRIANIIHECKLQSENLLVLGVSGGPDSLYLMHALHSLGCHIVAVHVNHKLRPEADVESEQVKQFVEQLGVNFIACRADVLTCARDKSISIEEAARMLRYRALFEQAKFCGACAVVVGHNADDQVETILMHLLRGSGLAGLRGMGLITLPNPWSEDIPLVRPLLTTWRAEIQKYLDDHHITAIFDSSNLDVSFFRNRLRHELLPILEDYNPSIRQVLARMSLSLKDDYSILEELTDKAWESLLISEGHGYLEFHTVEFLQLPLSIQRYFLRKAITYHLPGLSDVGFNCIERGIKLLTSEKTNSQTDLIAGLRLCKKGTQFWVTTWQADLQTSDYPAISIEENLIFLIPSTLILNNDWQFEAEESSIPTISVLQDEASLDPFQAWLDSSGLVFPLIIRARSPGDEIAPIGMNGHSMKISDVMINLKLPKPERATWPLVCSGNEIVWVPGYRICEHARVKADTSRIIHMRLFRNRTS
jgi:tRNA(Ile)-lysidine synthase